MTTPQSRAWVRLGPWLLILALALLFFAPLVVHPDQVLYSDTSDTIAQHIPAKHFLVHSWQETGELPLWCPYSYGGSPFVTDIQAAMFYPPHLLLCPLPEDWVAPGISWLIVLHLLLAGWGMYAYARWRELDRAAALVAALGWMYGGKWLLHLLAAGHYVTVGLAWLPLLLLCLERAIRRGRFRDAALAGAIYGLMTLSTQPQWTFYAGLFTALWTLGTALECAGLWEPHEVRLSLGRALLRWAGFGAWTALLAAGCAAVALLPAWEGAAYSTRAVGVDTSDVLPGGLRALLFLIGPALNSEPGILAWEDRGGFTLLWLVAAALAPVLCRGRVGYQAGVTALLFLFAFGGAILFQPLPGFRLFRQATRMLIIAAFPVAFLAGVTTQRLFSGLDWNVALAQRCRRVLRLLLPAAAILVGGFAVRLLRTEEPLAFHPYWVSLLLTVPTTVWVLSTDSASVLHQRRLVWTVLLTVDLWALVWPLVAVRPEGEVYAPSACVRYVIDQTRGQARVLDVCPLDTRTLLGLGASTVGLLSEPLGQGPFLAASALLPGRADMSIGTPLGTGAPLAMIYRLEALRGYNPLDVLRYKEYLQFLSGEDEPLQPFSSVLTFPVTANFPLKHKPLLDLLGVRYLLQPGDQLPPHEGWVKVADDPRPRAYDLDHGMVDLPPYAVYENSTVLPRVFVVHDAAPLPDRPKVLPALLATDFRRKVLLEDLGPDAVPKPDTAPQRTATIRSHLPNQVVVDVADGPAGYLVLTDLWFPGWTCTVDGSAQVIHRANFLFRAVPVPAGPHQVVFTFAPESYRRGAFVTGLAVLLIVIVQALATLRALWGSAKRTANPVQARPNPQTPHLAE